MAFNLMSFLGGFSGGGSQLLDEKRARDEQKKVTAEQRQWQIATESRADSRAKKARRDSQQDALDSLIEEASFYFDPEDMKKMQGLGKSKLSASIAQAKELNKYGIYGKDLFKLPSINGPDDMPNATDVSKTLPITSGSFAAIPTGTEAFKGNYEQYEVHLHEKIRMAKTQKEKDNATSQLIEIQNLQKKDEEGNYKDNAITVATKNVDTLVDSYFKAEDRIELSPTGEYLKRIGGNEPSGFQVEGKALESIVSNPAYTDDSVLQGVMKGKLQNLESRVTNYANSAINTYQKYTTEVAKLNTMPDSKEQQDKVAMLESSKKSFVPLDPANPITIEDINNGAYRNYEPNTVIQVQDKSGEYGFVITTGNGVIKLPGNI